MYDYLVVATSDDSHGILHESGLREQGRLEPPPGTVNRGVLDPFLSPLRYKR